MVSGTNAPHTPPPPRPSSRSRMCRVGTVQSAGARVPGSPSPPGPTVSVVLSHSAVRPWSSEPFHSRPFPGFQGTASEAARCLERKDESRPLHRRTKPPAHLPGPGGRKPLPAASRLRGKSALPWLSRAPVPRSPAAPARPTSLPPAAEQLSFLLLPAPLSPPRRGVGCRHPPPLPLPPTPPHTAMHRSCASPNAHTLHRSGNTRPVGPGPRRLNEGSRRGEVKSDLCWQSRVP